MRRLIMRLEEYQNGKEVRSVESRIDVDSYHLMSFKLGFLDESLNLLEKMIVNPNYQSEQCECGEKGKP